MATDIITKFTFRTYSQEEENQLKAAMDYSKEESMLKAIKKVLGKLQYFRDLERDYWLLKREHETLVELIKDRERINRKINSILKLNP
jgi:hypothetical protein